MTHAADGPDIKPRSRDVTDGLERAAARGMLRAVGMGDDDFAKPQIGVASSWNEITPCNLSLDRLAKAVKNGVHAGGGPGRPLLRLAVLEGDRAAAARHPGRPSGAGSARRRGAVPGRATGGVATAASSLTDQATGMRHREAATGAPTSLQA